ncbi:MAG: hypothetical protein K8953_12880, partial [Proteobacteria bacterium]|nr:hypothetical protein [Pseudomonadota bacterium]
MLCRSCRVANKNQCAGTVARVCTGNGIFGAVCLRADVTADYATQRADACRDNTNGANDCAQTVIDVCTASAESAAGPFDALCTATYLPARLAHCADHTIANKNSACADQVDGSGIVETYCAGLSGGPDLYGVCDSTNGNGFTAWRGNDDSSPVIGAGSATGDDPSANFIAGGANALYLGSG